LEALNNCPFPVYALGFRLTDNRDEEWTTRFNDFKYGRYRWGRAAVRGARAAVPDAVRTIGLGTDVTVLCAIPSSAEVVLGTSRVAQMAAAIARANSWVWYPSGLRKQIHHPLHGLGAAVVRDAEVRNRYAATGIAAGTVLVVDDFVTRGSTLNEIARAIRLTSPSAKVCGLVLAKNESANFWKEQGIDIDNAHIPPHVTKRWDEG
jgi:hypothetical protein